MSVRGLKVLFFAEQCFLAWTLHSSFRITCWFLPVWEQIQTNPPKGTCVKVFLWVVRWVGMQGNAEVRLCLALANLPLAVCGGSAILPQHQQLFSSIMDYAFDIY